MRSPTFTAFVLASILAVRTWAVTLNQWTQLKTFTYDYVIIGGESITVLSLSLPF
jgi:hypothetical protein